MRYSPLVSTLASLLIVSCNNSERSSNKVLQSDKDKFSICSDGCKAKSKSENLSCKLTTPELQKRKATVLENLRRQIMKKKELKDGYAFKFSGSDKMIDELIEFIKTERECCDFFTFNLSIGGDKKEVCQGILL